MNLEVMANDSHPTWVILGGYDIGVSLEAEPLKLSECASRVVRRRPVDVLSSIKDRRGILYLSMKGVERTFGYCPLPASSPESAHAPARAPDFIE